MVTMLWTASYAVRKAEEQSDPFLSVITKKDKTNPRPNEHVEAEEEADTQSESASSDAPRAKELTKEPAKESANELVQRPDLNKKTSPRKKRQPIRRPGSRLDNQSGTKRIDTTRSAPTIVEEPMVTENRLQRINRQERFKWLLDAWSPGV